jgi:hypothetical protein
LIWHKSTPENLSKDPGEIFFKSLGSIIAASIMHDLPLRLGVAYGECYIHKKFNVYIGKPIIDAYQLSEAQDWIGGAIHNTCINLPITKSIIDYIVPLKEECEVKKYCLDKT